MGVMLPHQVLDNGKGGSAKARQFIAAALSQCATARECNSKGVWHVHERRTPRTVASKFRKKKAGIISVKANGDGIEFLVRIDDKNFEVVTITMPAALRQGDRVSALVSELQARKPVYYFIISVTYFNFCNGV